MTERYLTRRSIDGFLTQVISICIGQSPMCRISLTLVYWTDCRVIFMIEFISKGWSNFPVKPKTIILIHYPVEAFFLHHYFRTRLVNCTFACITEPRRVVF